MKQVEYFQRSMWHLERVARLDAVGQPAVDAFVELQEHLEGELGRDLSNLQAKHETSMQSSEKMRQVFIRPVRLYEDLRI